jgi:hypothetical protein
MLEAAEKVVENAKAFEAMFDPTAPVKPVAGPQTQTPGTQVSHRAVWQGFKLISSRYSK